MRGLRFALAAALHLTVLMPTAVRAQWHELTVGSEVDSYVRALQLRGVWNGEPVSIRGYGTQAMDRWAGEAVPTHPWESRFSSESSLIWPLRPAARVSFNSAYPWGINDGAVWQGRGATVATTLGFGARWRWLSLRVEPTYFRAQNGDFRLLGDTTAGANPFVDQQRPGSIDLPQRFGRAPYGRIDAGQSELRVDVGPLAAGVSTMSRFWGPGIGHSLLLGGSGTGFPHFFVGSSRAVRTRVGRLAGQVVYGKLSSSGYAPAAPTSARFGSGLVAVWQPPSGRGFELGFSRFYHRPWPQGGLRVGDLTVPFGSLFEDVQVFGGGAADNQLVSLFARWRAEEDGFEIFGEFGRNDRSGDGRDLALEPEHNSAWLLGFAKSYLLDAQQLWMVRSEFVNGRITSLQQLGRGQATFYEHSPITQGHTARGRLLGSPLLERSTGFELAVDRWTRLGRAGVRVLQRAMPPDRAEGVALATARSQWYTEGSVVRFVGSSEFFVRAGLVFDLNRRAGSDQHNVHLMAGARLGF